MTYEELLQDIQINLGIDEDQSKDTLKYFKTHVMEELIYSGFVRIGDMGFLRVSKTPSGRITIKLEMDQKFLSYFRKNYRTVHAMEVKKE